MPNIKLQSYLEVPERAAADKLIFLLSFFAIINWA